MENVYRVDNEVLRYRPEIRIGDRIYKIDDRLSVYQKINRELKEAGEMGEFYIILANALGKEAYEEIMALEPSYKAVEKITVLVLAAMQGIGEDEAVGRFQKAGDGE